MSSKQLLAANGYTWEVKRENADRDFLFRTNTYTLKNKAGQVVASFQTTPFPKCCGLRVWQNTSSGFNFKIKDGKYVYDYPPTDIFEAFLSEAWEDDQKQNRPGLYMATIVLHKEGKEEVSGNYKMFDEFFRKYSIQIMETRNPIYTNHSIRTYSFVHPAMKEAVVDRAGEKYQDWSFMYKKDSFDLFKGEVEHA